MKKLIGYCECCGIEIYECETYAKIDGLLYCDYCGGDDGFSISELKELDNESWLQETQAEIRI